MLVITVEAVILNVLFILFICVKITQQRYEIYIKLPNILCDKYAKKIIHLFFYPRNIERDESRPYNFVNEYSRNKHETMDVVNHVPTKSSIPHTLSSSTPNS